MTALRSGYSTGACAAAAAKAATLCLTGVDAPEVEIPFPDGTRHRFQPAWTRHHDNSAEAAVLKDAGDDPDIIHGSLIIASVSFLEGTDVEFAAGEGIGRVTKSGLQIAPGQPAINPVPRQMIRAAVREVTGRGIRVTISIPAGKDLAQRTFNPRLGIEGGLSIIGTSGYVRPFSVPSLRASLKCALDIAAASGISHIVLTPGNIGERAARRHLRVTPDQVVQVSNEWDFMLDAARTQFDRILVVGHPGKLAKLAVGQWDTHSARSDSALPVVTKIASDLSLPVDSDTLTVEGVFESLPTQQQAALGLAVASAIRKSVEQKTKRPTAVFLVNMQGEQLGCDGDLTPWR